MARKRNSLDKRGKTSTSFRRQKILPVKSSRQFKQSRKLKKKAIRTVSDASFSLSYLTDTLVSTPVPGSSKKGKGRGKRSGKFKANISISSVDSMLLSGNVEVSKDTSAVAVDPTICQSIRDKFRNDHILGGPSTTNPTSDSVAGGKIEIETIVIEDDEDDATLTPSVVGNIMLNLVEPHGEEKSEATQKAAPVAQNQTVELDDTLEDDVLIVDERNFPSLPRPSKSSNVPLTSSNMQQVTTRYPSKAPDFIPLLNKISQKQRQKIYKNRIVKRLQPIGVSRKFKSKIHGTVSRATPDGGQGGSGVIVASGPTMLSEAGGRPSPAGVLRPIVIDGSNVAMNHGQKKVFSVRGIDLVVRYFENRGHKRITAFVPEFRKKFNQSSDQKLLEKLEDEQRVSFTPSRTVDGVHINSYDDTFILDYAAQHGAIVVTRDQYRDLINEKPEWREVIEKRILMQTFVGDDLMFPHDPLGRGGPNLDTFLRF